MISNFFNCGNKYNIFLFQGETRVGPAHGRIGNTSSPIKNARETSHYTFGFRKTGP